MLGNDICILVEHNESYGTAFGSITSPRGNGKFTYVVPQSKDPTNSPCFKLLFPDDPWNRFCWLRMEDMTCKKLNAFR